MDTNNKDAAAAIAAADRVYQLWKSVTGVQPTSLDQEIAALGQALARLDMGPARRKVEGRDPRRVEPI